MIIRKCLYCGKEFKTTLSQLNAGYGKYCSKKCSYNSLRNGKTKLCPICKNEFYVKKSAFKRRKYCSRSCANKARSLNQIFIENRVEKTCLFCNKTFYTTPNEINRGRGKYCSHKCFSNDKKTREKRICLECGSEFEVPQWKINIGEGNFCSRACFNANPLNTNRPRGSENHAWKGGISFEPYCPQFNEEFKERVRKFWNRKCGICGKSEQTNGKKLSVHHVNYEKMVFCDTTSPIFIPLCSSCHPKTNHNRTAWENILTEYIMIHFNGDSYIKIKNV